MNLSTLDFVIFLGYCFLILGLGLFIASRKTTGDSEGYFLVGKSLPWSSMKMATGVFHGLGEKHGMWPPTTISCMYFCLMKVKPG